MAKTQTDLNDLWDDLKGNPALLFVIVGIIAVALYYVYKKNNASTTISSANSIPVQSPYYLINDIITPPGVAGPPGPQGPPGPTGSPTPPPPPGLKGKTRSKVDADKNISGVPVYQKPAGTIARYYPYSSDVTVTGTTSAVNGVDYYPIEGGGYIRERDLIGFG